MVGSHLFFLPVIYNVGDKLVTKASALTCHLHLSVFLFLPLLTRPPYFSLRVVMPVQRARHSWATTSPLHSPPQQATEDHPCIPAPATAAYRLWAGEHMQSCTIPLPYTIVMLNHCILYLPPFLECEEVGKMYQIVQFLK